MICVPPFARPAARSLNPMRARDVGRSRWALGWPKADCGQWPGLVMLAMWPCMPASWRSLLRRCTSWWLSSSRGGRGLPVRRLRPGPARRLSSPPRGSTFERVRHRPHVAVVQVRYVLEAQGRVAVAELARVLEEDDDLAVRVRVSGHPVPGLRRQLRGGRGDRHMHALGERTIGSGPRRGARAAARLRTLPRSIVTGASRLQVEGRFVGAVHVERGGVVLVRDQPLAADLAQPER
jgi:hypothetical protein